VVTVEGKAGDGGQDVRIPPNADVAVSVPDGHDVDAETIEAGLNEAAAERTVLVEGQTNKDAVHWNDSDVADDPDVDDFDLSVLTQRDMAALIQGIMVGNEVDPAEELDRFR